METMTETAEAPTHDIDLTEAGVAREDEQALKTPTRLFKWSAYIDAGEDATTCPTEFDEESRTGKCNDSQHFHAWLRLPNQFQHDEIRTKALAAKARKMRQLRDTTTDAHEILEGEMDDLLRQADKETLIEEMVSRDAVQEQLTVLREIGEEEEYLTVEDDQKRLHELEEKGELETDEARELVSHLTAYHEKIEESLNKVLEPRRESLRNRDMGELVDMVREDRIGTEGTSAFLHVYNIWAWLVGCMTSDRSGRKFGDIEHLKAASEEVIEAIQSTHQELEAAQQKDFQGNS